MYRFFLLILVVAGTALSLKYSFPWYLPAVVAGVASGLLPVWRRSAFWFSFLGALLVWGLYTGYLHFESEGRLSDRLAVTFNIGSGWMLVLVTALWGGITGGLGGWFGASIRRSLHFARTRE